MAADDADDWPIGPALALYDVNTDRARPCTQADLDGFVRLATAAVRAAAVLISAGAAVPPKDPGDG